MPDSMTQVVAIIKRDPKKVGVLVVLVVLLGFMWMRTLGSKSGKPASASAAAIRSGSGKSASAGAATRGPSVNAHLQSWSASPVLPVSRNLFAVKLDYFPFEGPRTPRTERDRAEEGFWARLEKSLVVQADQRDKRENQIANYMAQASRLRLQSTMMGPQPKAMVNGELVGEGDVVASFRVVRIEARRIIIEREGIRLEIQMK